MRVWVRTRDENEWTTSRSKWTTSFFLMIWRILLGIRRAFHLRLKSCASGVKKQKGLERSLCVTGKLSVVQFFLVQRVSNADQVQYRQIRLERPIKYGINNSKVGSHEKSWHLCVKFQTLPLSSPEQTSLWIPQTSSRLELYNLDEISTTFRDSEYCIQKEFCLERSASTHGVYSHRL